MHIQDDRKSPVSNGLSYDLFAFSDKCTLDRLGSKYHLGTGIITKHSVYDMW